MGTSSRSDKRRGKRKRLDDGGASSSSSSTLHVPNADPPDDTTIQDPGEGVLLEAEETPPGARLLAQGRPPPGASLEARGRPPPAEAGKEEVLFLGILPSDPARFEIMDPIPQPLLPLPPEAMIEAFERCLQGHRRLPGEGDAAQGHGDRFGTPSRSRRGQYG